MNKMISGELLEKWIIDNAGTHYLPKFELLDAIQSGSLSPPAPCEVVEGLRKRYEDQRQECLRYGGLYPEDKSVCHQAIRRAKNLDAVAVHLAALCDDMMLALSRQPSGSGWLPKDEPAIKYCEHGVPYAIPCDECFPPPPPQEVNNGSMMEKEDDTHQNR